MTSANNLRFNAEAAAWDSQPSVQQASKLALQTLLQRIPSLSSQSEYKAITDLDVLEIGCGTGVLSFMVAPYVHSIVAVDPAEGMVSALKLKLAASPEVQNIFPVNAILGDPDDERIHVAGHKRFDLILSHLVLHHIPSLQDVLRTMYGCLKEGGMVALTDFEDFGPEARRFHPENKMDGVERHGISRKEMEKLMREAGFKDLTIETAFSMEKRVEKVPGEGLGEGKEEMMEFPFLICMGRK
jgi:SAM-dependent methyltransferase